MPRDSKDLVLLPSPSNSVPCTFNQIWLRMTAQECLNVCSAYGLVTSLPVLGDGTGGTMPSELSAEGALAWMSWNNGAGSYDTQYDPLTPRKIQSAGALTLWLDGLDNATVLDGAGDPVTGGGSVATWKDKSGGGGDFVQSTSGQRPVWGTAGYISFNGGTTGTQFLATSLTLGDFLSADDNTIVIVASVSSATDPLFDFLITDGGTTNLIALFGAGQAVVGTLHDTLNAQGPAIVAPTGPQYIILLRRSTTPALFLSLNGGTETSAAASGSLDTLGGTVYIPGADSQAKPACKIYEVLIYNRDIGSADRNTLGQYLQGKWGIPWLAGVNSYRYRNGLFNDSAGQPIHAVQIRQALQSIFDNDPDDFLFQVCGTNGERRGQLLQDIPSAVLPSLVARTPTQIIFWDSDPPASGPDGSAYGVMAGLYPSADSRGNIVRLVSAYYDNSSGIGTYDDAAFAARLGPLGAGKRWIKCGGGAALWAGLPYTDGTYDYYPMYDNEYAGVRRGLCLETWFPWIMDFGRSGQPGIYQFCQAVITAMQTSYPGSTIDGLITDVERLPTMADMQGVTDWFAESPVSTTAPPQKCRVLVSGVTPANPGVINAPSHNLVDNQPIAFYSTGSLPAPLAPGTLYYVDYVDADNIEVRTSVAGTPIELTSEGSGAIYILIDSLVHCIELDTSTWSTAVGLLPDGVKGLLGPALDDSVWKQYPLLDYTQAELSFIFDTAMYQYYAGYMSQLMAKLRANIAGLKTIDYGTTYYASHDYYAGYSHEYGVGDNCGMLATTLYGDTSTGIAKRWNWAQYSLESAAAGNIGQNEWAAFSVQHMRLRNAVAAGGDVAYTPWLTTEVSPLSMMGAGGLWSELVHHCVLNCSGYVAYYQSLGDAYPSGYTDAQIAAAQYKMVQLVAEADGVLAYNSTRDPGLTVDEYTGAVIARDIEFNPGNGSPFATSMFYTRAYAGNRWVWRVTPNPNVSTTVTRTPFGVRFDNSIGYLDIKGGRINSTSQSAIAPLGYWVEQTPQVS